MVGKWAPRQQTSGKTADVSTMTTDNDKSPCIKKHARVKSRLCLAASNPGLMMSQNDSIPLVRALDASASMLRWLTSMIGRCCLTYPDTR